MKINILNTLVINRDVAKEYGVYAACLCAEISDTITRQKSKETITYDELKARSVLPPLIFDETIDVLVKNKLISLFVDNCVEKIRIEEM